MGFPTSVADEVLVRCRRHCCLCGRYVGQKIELHHIIQVAKGGDDSVDNCIPLCFDCHAEVKSYNPDHPKGRKFTEKELKGHRDRCYAQHDLVSSAVEGEKIEEVVELLFSSPRTDLLPNWGYSEQDSFCPIRAGYLVLIAGYAGTKKSTYVQHVVNWNLKHGQKVTYCCLKEHPTDVAIDIIAEVANVRVNDVRFSIMTEESWKRIVENLTYNHNENLVLLPYDRVANCSSILNLMEKLHGEMVVIDDFNGIEFENQISVEKFFYQMKNIARKNNVVVFCIYNLEMPIQRGDMRPILSDFPSDSFFRLFDVVQVLFRPEMHYRFRDDEKGALEVINLKGAWKNPCTFRMFSTDDITGVFPANK